MSTTEATTEDDGSEASAAVPPPVWVAVEKGMLSRVLYPNPVCLLSVWDVSQCRANVMTITWLTPVNNQGGFICSVNCNRYTASFVSSPGALFVLNVPVRGMEELVLAIGGCSGANVDKFTELGIVTCAPGSNDASVLDTSRSRSAADVDADCGEVGVPTNSKKPKLSRQEVARQVVDDAAAKSVAIRGCAAHVICRVESAQTDEGHWTLRCSQLAAWCNCDYWDGKNFLSRSPTAAPFLTFLGSKVFGYVVSSDHAGLQE
ncbi:hypothetical protein PybrP1_004960 [[Pythium] brassicae (nom. inval.)]|nr:hypothetical protein PybrP1_004960 [[Pythium] brassicae (nom. inval.)]